jgi:SPP1 family predicted phage head-tail adaptor
VLNAGRLDRRVTIQHVTETVGDARGLIETWATISTVWGDVRPISGREFLAADRENAEATTKVTIRWRSDVTTKHRVIAEGKTYGIAHVAEIGRREGLELLCIEEQL